LECTCGGGVEFNRASLSDLACTAKTSDQPPLSRLACADSDCFAPTVGWDQAEESALEHAGLDPVVKLMPSRSNQCPLHSRSVSAKKKVHSEPHVSTTAYGQFRQTNYGSGFSLKENARTVFSNSGMSLKRSQSVLNRHTG
jgi:hypothetical protein